MPDKELSNRETMNEILDLNGFDDYDKSQELINDAVSAGLTMSMVKNRQEMTASQKDKFGFRLSN